MNTPPQLSHAVHGLPLQVIPVFPDIADGAHVDPRKRGNGGRYASDAPSNPSRQGND